METVSYSQQPEAIQYVPLPDGSADVWLRRNITQVDDEDTWGWEAEETYIHTDLTRDEVAANFDALFNGTYDPEAPTTLEGIRVDKIAEMSEICKVQITEGLYVELSDGVHHFSFSADDQADINGLVTERQQKLLEAILGGATAEEITAIASATVEYHADGELCTYFSAEDFTAIVNAMTIWRKWCQAYFNSLRNYINALEDATAIKGIKWGIAVPGEYQSDVYKSYQELASQLDGSMG